YGSSALDALNKLAEIKGLAVDNPSGNYVTGIGGISAGLLGGMSGWSYAVKRDGEWAEINTGMKDFMLKDGDKLNVYYGDYGVTQLIDSVSFSPQQPKQGMGLEVGV
ncbi:DUF4430 domain-containing protein, partial [Paenibacillus forsythiae]